MNGWGLSLEGFLSLLLGRFSVEYSSVLQVRPFRVVVSVDWSVTGQGSSVIAVGSGVAHLVLLLSREEKLPWEVLVFLN